MYPPNHHTLQWLPVVYPRATAVCRQWVAEATFLPHQVESPLPVKIPTWPNHGRTCPLIHLLQGDRRVPKHLRDAILSRGVGNTNLCIIPCKCCIQKPGSMLRKLVLLDVAGGLLSPWDSTSSSWWQKGF